MAKATKKPVGVKRATKTRTKRVTVRTSDITLPIVGMKKAVGELISGQLKLNDIVELLEEAEGMVKGHWGSTNAKISFIIPTGGQSIVFHLEQTA